MEKQKGLGCLCDLLKESQHSLTICCDYNMFTPKFLWWKLIPQFNGVERSVLLKILEFPGLCPHCGLMLLWNKHLSMAFPFSGYQPIETKTLLPSKGPSIYGINLEAESLGPKKGISVLCKWTRLGYPDIIT